MSGAATLIGRAPCVVCDKPARVSLSKKQWPVMTCQACGIQLFVRGNVSDALIRARLVTEPQAAPAPAPVAPEPQRNVTASPAPARPVTAPPATTPATPTPAPAQRASWGAFPWLK